MALVASELMVVLWQLKQLAVLGEPVGCAHSALVPAARRLIILGHLARIQYKLARIQLNIGR